MVPAVGQQRTDTVSWNNIYAKSDSDIAISVTNVKTNRVIVSIVNTCKKLIVIILIVNLCKNHRTSFRLIVIHVKTYRNHCKQYRLSTEIAAENAVVVRGIF